MKTDLSKGYGTRYKVCLGGFIVNDYNLHDTKVKSNFYGVLFKIELYTLWFQLDGGDLVAVPRENILLMLPTIEQEENDG